MDTRAKTNDMLFIKYMDAERKKEKGWGKVYIMKTLIKRKLGYVNIRQRRVLVKKVFPEIKRVMV